MYARVFVLTVGAASSGSREILRGVQLLRSDR
jgi:hypothetical protein